jgi:hypothetical protein
VELHREVEYKLFTNMMCSSSQDGKDLLVDEKC